VTRVLGRPPSEWKKLPKLEIDFIKAGIIWEQELSAERGPLFLF
jgi:hypothetical protein